MLWVKQNLSTNMSEFFGPWSKKGDDEDMELVEETVETVTTTTTRKRPAVSQQYPEICLVTYDKIKHSIDLLCSIPLLLLKSGDI